MSTLTPVVVWADGEVSTGTDRLRHLLQEEAIYGGEVEEPTEVYVNDNGHLVRVGIMQEQGAFDNDDYATVTVRLYKMFGPDAREARLDRTVLTFTYTIDGRA